MIVLKCKKGIPLEHESFLLQRYDSFKTTCRYMEAYYPTCDIHHLLVYEDDVLRDILIYANRGKIADCFNLLIEIDQDIISLFTKHIFETYPQIEQVKIQASYSQYSIDKSYLFSNFNDYVLALPATIEEYFAALGSNTRRHIRSYKVKFLKEYPHAEFLTVRGKDIQLEMVETIFKYNRERMLHKGILPGLDNIEMNKVFEYAKHYGCVYCIKLDGKFVAGSIFLNLNKRTFGLLTSYDSYYSKFNVGQMCIVYSIQCSIENGFSSYHFLWGDNEYKTKLLAKPSPLYSYCIHRAYTVDFFVGIIKAKIYNQMVKFRQSELTKPLREAIKSYRSKRHIGKK